MLALAATMLLFGGQALIEGLLTVRDPKKMVRLVSHSQARTPLEEASQRKLEPIQDAIVARNRTALRVDAVASIVLGSFVLYAAAAALVRDRNGRRLALFAAAFGIVFFVGSLVLWVRMFRETVAVAGPLLNEIAANAASGAGRTSTQLATAVVARSPVLAALGIGWCTLLLVYFGGRRGRELYGISRA